LEFILFHGRNFTRLKLVVGLGNPGRKYENTRHNVGFKIAVALADRHGIRINTKAFNSLIGKGKISGEEIVIALPQTYMNRSGEAVKAIFSRRKTELKDILVVCDDVNLSLGIIRIRAQGSSGGHNGLVSIIEHLGSGDFARLRIGIGKEIETAGLSGYVLSAFSKNEKIILDEVVETCVDCCETWIRCGAECAANKFNLKNRKEEK